MIVKAQCSTWTLDLFQPSILLQVLLLAYIQFLKFAMAIVYSCSCELWSAAMSYLKMYFNTFVLVTV